MPHFRWRAPTAALLLTGCGTLTPRATERPSHWATVNTCAPYSASGARTAASATRSLSPKWIKWC